MNIIRMQLLTNWETLDTVATIILHEFSATIPIFILYAQATKAITECLSDREGGGGGMINSSTALTTMAT